MPKLGDAAEAKYTDLDPDHSSDKKDEIVSSIMRNKYNKNFTPGVPHSADSRNIKDEFVPDIDTKEIEPHIEAAAHHKVLNEFNDSPHHRFYLNDHKKAAYDKSSPAFHFAIDRAIQNKTNHLLDNPKYHDMAEKTPHKYDSLLPPVKTSDEFNNHIAAAAHHKAVWNQHNGSAPQDQLNWHLDMASNHKDRAQKISGLPFYKVNHLTSKELDQEKEPKQIMQEHPADVLLGKYQVPKPVPNDQLKGSFHPDTEPHIDATLHHYSASDNAKVANMQTLAQHHMDLADHHYRQFELKNKDLDTGLLNRKFTAYQSSIPKMNVLPGKTHYFDPAD